LGETRPGTIVFQLADKSVCYPQGKIEDVLIQVYTLVFFVDFIITGFKVDVKVPIIF
jgi:hypothetical protein